jgi:hypothetical protein
MNRGGPIFFLLLILSLFPPLGCGQRIGVEEPRSPNKIVLSSQALFVDGIKIHFVEAEESGSSR